jgi:ribonuclease D
MQSKYEDPEIIFVDGGSLDFLINLSLRAKVVAVDTEFMHTSASYYGALSLVQLFFGEEISNKIYVVDARSKDFDMESLKIIFQMEEVVKVFHSCQQDCETLSFAFGKAPKPIIDTQVMANFIGLGVQVGYAFLVDYFFGIKLSKDNQFSKWLARPLTEDQIKYAALDVFYLLKVYNKMLPMLQENPILYETFLARCQDLSKEKFYSRNQQKAWLKFKNSDFVNKRDFSYKDVDVMKRIFLYRNELAKKYNKIPQVIISDRSLVEIVKNGCGFFQKCIPSPFINNKEIDHIMQLFNIR